MFRNIVKPAFVLTTVALIGAVLQARALPTIGTNTKKKLMKTAAGCDPATATIELDINNVRARLMTGGDMWWNQGTGNAAYEVPKGTKKNSLFAGSVWVGGFTGDKQLKVCAQTYRATGNDYWPGPLSKQDGVFQTTREQCADWDRFWKVDRVTINKFRQLFRTGNVEAVRIADFESIWEWPARGNGIVAVGEMNSNDFKRATGTSGLPLQMEDREYAPFVDDLSVPGNKPGIYEPEKGDFPGDASIGDLLGDQYIWWVFNDRGNTKGQTKTESIGMEVQTGAFAFASKDFMNDATFYNYHLINHGTSDLDSTFMATWTDADLGYAFDDYIGCDTVRGLGILYNGDGTDGAGEAFSYGTTIPMVGVDFFRGPHRPYTDPTTGLLKDSVLKMTAFTYFNNGDDQRIGDPTNGAQVYNYITGTSRNGTNFNNDFVAAGTPSTALGAGPDTRFVFFGDPDKNEWSECNCRNPSYDRRFIHSAGPFVLHPGAVNDITIGAVWVSGTGGCPNTSFAKIRLADDQAQVLFDNNFKTIEGPEAPLLIKREMDRKIIFYLNNPSYSTNFEEKFGYQVDSSKYRVKSLKAINAKSPDSLYKFEGYRVFQLKSNQVTPANIFDERGEVNNKVAIEVFQCDLKNGVTQLINWTKDIRINNCDTCYYPSVKVEKGKDSGISHSFVVTQDAFATGNDKQLVNYKNYYFVAIAYSRNNFRNFDPGNAGLTQDVVYLESAHGPGGSAIPVVEAMPNPFSHNVGVDIVSDYGNGVIIKKLEGLGNGGNDLNMDAASVEEALSATTGYQSIRPTYEQGRGPVDIKVVDPLKVVPGTWSLYIKPDTRKPGPYIQPFSQADSSLRLVDSIAQWVLVKDGVDTIFSEMHLNVVNEQILANYGLSVDIKQEVRPGENQAEKNGLVTSEILFADTALTWMAGVNDGEQTDNQNWIRSGGYTYNSTENPNPPCNYNDIVGDGYDTLGQFYENLLPKYAFTKGTWAPYSLGAVEDRAGCTFGVAKNGSTRPLYDLQSVDIVFTSDMSKWSRCVVVETNNDTLTEKKVKKFDVRSHRSWDKGIDANGNPIYASDPNDTGRSWFPGYAINQETGERLNIVFGEDSYLTNHNGNDMLWNPSNVIMDNFFNPIWGGRHIVYISKTKYDGGDALYNLLKGNASNPNITEAIRVRFNQKAAFATFIWMGIPTVNNGYGLRSLRDGLIPTQTTVKLRVSRPYGKYVPAGVDTNIVGSNHGYPWYSFSTDALAKKEIGDAGNRYTNDKQKLLDKMLVVPNPYYANAPSYEANRLDTRVRIIGLPQRATVSIYSLDGSLIRRLDKDNAFAYIDWDTRNAKSLPIASGMYLIHINAEGVGEKIVRWFGAMRPIDITQY